MQSSYQQVPQNPDESYDSNYHRPYHDDEDTRDTGYGYSTHGYNHYRPPANSLKGKVEKKYWHTKQTMIQKLGKGQDSYVVAGDAEVDARLEAFRHIQKTCIDLLKAIEIYQNRIFALSQDENEMGRFLREQGSTDKSKAGKMMIAVGKAQSYSAQQRLGLRTPLVRLYQEVETFRFRAVSDTLQTVTRMETHRTDYRAALLWMSDISKELDPEEFRRLEKYREVQAQVKGSKKQFDRLKVDVMQKVDLLSASRCNLLSSTLAAYQQALLKFWENTSRTMRQVYEQFKGHPTYQFQMLKSLNPMPDEPDKEQKTKEVKLDQKTQLDEKNEAEGEAAKEATEEEDDDEQLINLDHSPAKDHQPPAEESAQPESLIETDLLGEDSGSPKSGPGAFIDLLGQDDLSGPTQDADDLLSAFEGPPPAKNGFQGSRAPPSYEEAKKLQTFPEILSGSSDLLSSQAPTGDKGGVTADDLLFGSPLHDKSAEPANTVDLLNQILSGDSRAGEASAEPENSFSQQWREMFGNEAMASSAATSATAAAPADQSGFMPSDLLDSMGRFDPFGGADVPSHPAPPPVGRTATAKGASGSSKMASMSGLLATSKQALTSGRNAVDKEKAKKAAGDLSAWFNLFSDLDPLANPDAVDKKNSKSEEERQC